MAASKSKSKVSKPAKPKRRTTAAILQSVRRRARVISVFGAFNSRVMIELPTELAVEVLNTPLLDERGRKNVITALEHELLELRKRAPKTADSAQAAAAIQLAYELEDPFNSATSKSMCARALNDTLEALRTLAPKPAKKDRIDELTAKRENRRARQAAAE